MKKTFLVVVFLSLAVCLYSCGTSTDKERELIEKERELLEREKALLEKDKKEVVQIKKKEKLKVSKESMSIEQIKNDLLGRSVEYLTTGLVKVRKTWKFAALSEFKEITVENQQTSNDYFEKTLNMVLEDYQNGQRYYMTLFVTYRKYPPDYIWVMDSYKVLNYKKL